MLILLFKNYCKGRKGEGIYFIMRNDILKDFKNFKRKLYAQVTIDNY